MSNAPNPYAWPQGHPNRPPQEYGYAPQQGELARELLLMTSSTNSIISRAASAGSSTTMSVTFLLAFCELLDSQCSIQTTIFKIGLHPDNGHQVHLKTGNTTSVGHLLGAQGFFQLTQKKPNKTIKGPQVGAPPPSNYWSQGYNYGPEPPRLAPPENINNSYGVENEWRMAPPAAAILPKTVKQLITIKMIEHLGLPPLRRLPKNHRKQRRDMNSIEIYSKWQSK
ncbi:uncharacterized protein J3D65DRAFT_668804 [Phyllosticta citribraziliensis]|uniref:Uncharacterized protein n=1 Tax=Phyllosticta citribraziliensis TaxID=989973 RepID=A0ABR1LNX9_9PEZI